MLTRTKTIMESAYPEMAAGGFTRFDGTVEFYDRINSLLGKDSSVLDFGAGRSVWKEQSCDFKKGLCNLKGRVKLVVGHDVDEAIHHNLSIDRAVMTRPGELLPFPDQSFDLVIADYVLEHVGDPAFVTAELARILKPGGWICARTPNKWGYVSLATRIVANPYHHKVLKFAQPAREEVDIFPTRFLLNTMAAVRKYFPSDRFENCSYYYQAEPSYHFDSTFVLHFMRFVDSLLPSSLWSNLFIFVRKL